MNKTCINEMERFYFFILIIIANYFILREEKKIKNQVNLYLVNTVLNFNFCSLNKHAMLKC